MNIVSIISSNIYRISVLVVTLALAITIFYLSLGHLKAKDFVANIKPVTPTQYTKWGQYAELMDFGVYVEDFTFVDYGQSKYLVDMYVWFVFNPMAVSLQLAESFAIDAGYISNKRLLDAKRIYDKLYVRYNARVEFTSPLNYKYYPLDSHRIYMIFKLDEVAPWEVILRSTYTRTVVDPGALPFNWKAVRAPSVDYGYMESELDSRMKDNVDFTTASAMYFDITRSSLREAIVIFVPLIVLLYIILASLLMATTSVQSVIITLMCMIGMIMHRFIITYIAPTPIVTYYMLSDCVFMLIFACSLIVLMFELINALYKREEEWWFDMMRSVALTFSSMLFLVGWVYLTYMW